MKVTDLRFPQKLLLILGILLIAVNLRPAIASVGPLISAIRADTGLSNTLLGFLTSLPLIAFGVISILTPLFTKRMGIEGTVSFALFLLSCGILLRVLPSNLALFGGTLIIGIAIALGNVLLPPLVKRYFPHRSGLMTSMYSSTLGVGAALGAGLSVPLAENAGLGWRWSLGAWALISLIALALWMPQLQKNIIPKNKRHFVSSMKHVGGSKMAWQIAVFMGLQSLAFYVVLAWLPEILQSRGTDAQTAGWLLSLSQATGVLGTLFVPIWAERISNRQYLIWILVILELVSLAGLMIPSGFMVTLWASLIGFSLGGSFGLALFFIVVKSKTTESTTELSGMTQTVGYLLAAGGPTIFGAIYDLTNAWIWPLLFLVATALIKLVAGLKASLNPH